MAKLRALKVVANKLVIRSLETHHQKLPLIFPAVKQRL